MSLTPAIEKDGFSIGAGTRLARLNRQGGLALEADRDRLLALLSVAARRAVPADEVLLPLAAASGYWQRGEKALANLRLVFSDLPRLASPVDVADIRDAADDPPGNNRIVEGSDGSYYFSKNHYKSFYPIDIFRR